MRAASDEAVLTRAQLEQRLVLTNDKDFGELAFHYGLPASCGVVLFRLSGIDPESDNQHVLQVLGGRTARLPNRRGKDILSLLITTGFVCDRCQLRV